jgi:hypothetical protein
MATAQIWNGTATFIPGSSTPFGFYDYDSDFQQEAPKVARYCAEKLGWPVMDVELNERQFYTAFEEAVTAYSKEVIEAIIAESISSQLGSSTSGTSVNNTIFRTSIQNAIETSAQYGTEAGVGGPVTLRDKMIDLVADQQKYDLSALIDDGPVEVRRVFYEAPPAILRYFDPYAGTGTGMQSLMDAFGFGNMSPGVNFLLMPVSFDVAKIQAIEFNDQIRKSAYSFEIHNNILTLFPIPKGAGKLKIQYYRKEEKTSSYINDAFLSTTGGGSSSGNTNSIGVITNISNANAQNLVFSEINAIGRQWIYKYAAATAKEILAYVRGKYETVPVPGSEARLNAGDLLTDARTEKAELIESLKATMQTASITNQLQIQSEQAQYLNEALQKVPMLIYVG